MTSLSEGSATPSTRSSSRYVNGVYQNTYTDIHDTYSYRETVGETTPNFHKRKAAGELLPHTTFNQIKSFGSTNAIIAVTGPGGTDTRTGYGPRDAFGADWLHDFTQGPSMGAPDFTGSVQDAAARISSGNHDTLTFVTELLKVKRMFVNILERIVKGKIPPISDVPGLWLEARYGLRTLWYDILSIQEAAEALKQPSRTRYSQRTGSSDSEYSFVSEIYNEDAYSYWRRDVEVFSAYSVRGSVTADVHWDTNFQLDPVATAWELIPWSFVIDWVVNIGQSIQAIEFSVLATDSVASGGYYIHERRTTSHTLDWKEGAPYTGSFQVSGTQNTYYTHREPTTVSTSPQVAVDLDALKSIDLAALFIRLLQ